MFQQEECSLSIPSLTLWSPTFQLVCTFGGLLFKLTSINRACSLSSTFLRLVMLWEIDQEWWCKVKDFSFMGLEQALGKMYFNTFLIVLHCWSHSRTTPFFMSLEKGCHWANKFGMNLHTKCFLEIWVPQCCLEVEVFWRFEVHNLPLFCRAYLNSPMPHYKSHEFVDLTPKAHFKGFFSRYCCSRQNIISRCFKWSTFWHDFAAKSSTSILLCFPTFCVSQHFLKVTVMACWYVADAFFRPNSMTQ